MREIQVAENKTLKLTNVLARKIDASELGNLGVILTQMQNFIKSHSAMPVGPVIQCVKFTSGPNPEPQIYFMMQVNQLIPRLEPGYEQDAVLRVKGCLYAHFTGPMDHSSLASQFGSLILGGEGDVHVELLTGGVANDLILEAGDEGAAAQGQVVVLSLAALKSDTVHKALEVDISDIAILSSTLHGAGRCARSGCGGRSRRLRQ